MEQQIGQQIDAAVRAATSGDSPSVEFESERSPPDGVMKIWELGEHRSELRFLRYPDSDEPYSSPWHVKVIGPDPLAGGRVDSIWSRGYEERDSAEGAAVGKLRDKHRRHQARGRVQAQALGEDFDFHEHECQPLLQIDMKVSDDIGIPEKRLELEEQVAEAIGYITRRVYSTQRGGVANHENVSFIVKVSPAEVWSSLNQKVEDLNDWADETHWIEDRGRDLSITLTGGDPEQIIRELESGQMR